MIQFKVGLKAVRMNMVNALKGSESYVKQWKDAINEYVNMGKTKNEKYLNNLENYFSSSKSGSSMKDYLVSFGERWQICRRSTGSV